MKAIILARVSSKEQEDNESIPAQTRRLQEYCERKNLEIIETCQLVESSTKSNRKKYQEIILKIKYSKVPIALVTDTIDRLQRDFRESVQLDEIRKQGKLELHFIRENLVINSYSNSADILRWDMGVMFAKSYVTQLRDNVKRSQEEKLRKGEWCGPAPFGYKNIKRNGKSWVEPDENSYIVQELFKRYASGSYSTRELTFWVNQTYGFHLSLSDIQYYLKNPFYYGMMRVKDKIYPHVYQTLISQELFDEARKVSDSRNMKKNSHKSFPKSAGRIPYLYRGLIRCADCGCLITPEQSKGHIYYHCTQSKGKHGARWFKEEYITSRIKEVISSIHPTEEQYTETIEAIKKAHEDQAKQKKQLLSLLNTELGKHRAKLSRLFDLYLEGSIDKTDYESKKKEIESEKHLCESRLQVLESASEDWYTDASNILGLLKDAPELFEKSSEVKEKQRIINLLFRNLEIKDNLLRWELKKPFDRMASDPIWLPELGVFPEEYWEIKKLAEIYL